MDYIGQSKLSDSLLVVTFLRFEVNYPGYAQTQTVPLLPEDRAKMLTREETDTAIFPKFEVEPWIEMMRKSRGKPGLNHQF